MRCTPAGAATKGSKSALAGADIGVDLQGRPARSKVGQTRMPRWPALFGQRGRCPLAGRGRA
jgi:hypothetical protein